MPTGAALGEWLVRDPTGRVMGPYRADELRARFESYAAEAYDCCQLGMTDWLALADVVALAGAVAPTPARAEAVRQSPAPRCQCCEGVGWWVCRPCRGGGTVISRTEDTMCRSCWGRGQTTCRFCRGTGRRPDLAD